MSGVRAYLWVPSNARVGRGRATCERCGSRARFCGLGGQWCAGCWSRRKADVRVTVRLLCEGYGVDADTLTMALGGQYGSVVLRPGTYGTSALRYHPNAEQLARYVSLGQGDKSRLDAYQMQLVARTLWGMALRAGIDLSDYPRDGAYPHAELPWNLIQWAEQSAWHFAWMARYGRALSAAYLERWGKAHKAGERCSWLAERLRGCRLAFNRSTPLPPMGAVVVNLQSAERAA